MSSHQPRAVRWAVVPAATLFVLGGLVGLVLGLLAYPPTAWFAVLEVGVPAGLAGAGVGALAGLLRDVRARTAR